MNHYVCSTCGTSYPAVHTAPAHCPICEDERQWVPPGGQTWSTSEQIDQSHAHAWALHEPGLFSLHPTPELGIGQRAFLLRTPAGNVLWDCTALLDDATKALVESLGGLAHIAISHPHYYTRMQDWSAAFGDVPIHLHAADRAWVVRPSPAIRFWKGETLELLPGVQLVCLGGHFPGATVLHWTDSHDRNGVLLCGDTLKITPDGERISFMWSYPNLLPLGVTDVSHIGTRLEAISFSRIYGAFPSQQVKADGKKIVQRAVKRYIELLK